MATAQSLRSRRNQGTRSVASEIRPLHSNPLVSIDACRCDSHQLSDFRESLLLLAFGLCWLVGARGMPTKANQKRGSYKPAGVQALVVEGRKSGHSMRRIARDSGIDRSTVTKNILSQPEIEMALQQSRDTVLAALPAISQMITSDILTERDRELGFQVLKNAGAFPKEDGKKANTLLQDNRLQVAIQTLISPARV
jgi:hypothetical protein